MRKMMRQNFPHRLVLSLINTGNSYHYIKERKAKKIYLLRMKQIHQIFQ